MITERDFRFILGFSLILILYFNLAWGFYLFLGILTFEGISNFRVPTVVNIFWSRNSPEYNFSNIQCGLHGFEAERALRFVIVAMLLSTHLFLNETAWFLPWFVGMALVFAGVSNVCPMAISLKAIGFK